MNKKLDKQKTWNAGRCARTGKVAYLSRKAAKVARKRFKPDAGGADRLNAYQCDACGFWHLGRLPPDVKRGERVLPDRALAAARAAAEGMTDADLAAVAARHYQSNH